MKRLNVFRTVMVVAVVCTSTAMFAVPPGPIDGEDIAADFGAENLRAVQRNHTSFGDYSVSEGALIQGNELDALYLAKDSQNLYIAITGNLATNGNALMIGIDVPNRTGHTENRAEGAGFCGVDGPPWTLQESAREVVIDDNMTPEDPTDDTWSYGVDGTIFPCETDYMFAVDVFNGGININKYTLYDTTAGPIFSWDPTPDNLTDDLADSFAEKENVGGGPTNDGNDVLENAGPVSEGGFDNTNVDGVTDVDGSTALTATTGFEVAIPFSQLQTDLGDLDDTDAISVYVLLMDGVESNCEGDNWGYVINQVLPSLAGGSTPCEPAELIGPRPDLTAFMSCLNVDLSTLATFSGVAEGMIDPAEYDPSVLAVQNCPTPYGDQIFDPESIVQGGGSELDALYVTSDGTNLYLGIAGNLEENGNRMLVWLDNGQDDSGEHFLTWDGMGEGGSGMEGDALPPFESDTNTDVLFDNVVSINISGAPPSSSVFVDLWDIIAQTSTYKGFAVMQSGSGQLGGQGDGASNQWNMQVALNNLNNEGVIGCGFFEDPCFFDDDVTVEALAEQVTSGFEFAIPLADIGINPCDGPADISVWANVTGGDGWRSNQTLPSLRGAGQEMVWQPENNVTDWYQEIKLLPETFYQAVAVTHTTTPAIENDCDENGVEDTCDILDGTHEDADMNGIPDICQATVAERPFADDRFDILGTVKACVDDAECKAGAVGPDPQTVCRDGACYVARQRYLSVRTNPANAGNSYSYRISLDTGVAGSAVLGFTGAPDPTAVTGPGPSIFNITRIDPTPFYLDWTTVPTGIVTIGDCEVSLGNNYLVQTVVEGADLGEESNYSTALELPTPQHNGDVTGGGNPGAPPNGDQGTLVDVFSMIKAFQATQNEPKDWLDFEPEAPNMVHNLADAFQGILAFQQNPYPFSAPLDCP
ncbi:MAG: hypothetical protein ACYTHJ_16985 [Planctomycetota bacterium]|jgi:hypothetical protein